LASIKKHPASPYWTCCYRKANGDRTQRSTKQTDKNNAWVACLAWAEAERKAVQGILTEAQARRVIGEIVERTTGEPLQFYTVKSWLKEWVVGKGQTKSESTGVRYAQVINAFIKHLGKRADLNIAHIIPRDLQTFRDAESKAGKAGRTCNLSVKIIGGAFNAARRQGLIQTNPAEALEALPQKTEVKGVFSIEQVTDLLKCAPTKDWRLAILLAYYIGARLQDVANMTWNLVNLSNKTIRFTPRKTSRSCKEIIIPIHPQLLEQLLKIAGQDDPDVFLFPTLAGRKSGGAHGLSKTFARIMVDAGINAGTVGPRKSGLGRKMSKLSFHSFRHGFNSAMANKGVAQEIRQLLSGHASAEMNKNYTHHELEPLRAAVDVIPRLKIS